MLLYNVIDYTKAIVMRKLLFTFLTISLFVLSACSQSKPVNGTATKTNKNTDVVPIAEYIQDKDYSGYQVATFAGGCFWCTEASFERIKGVKDVISGYSGGKTEYPTYTEVGTGATGHAEAIQVFYDPKEVNFATLLRVFFVAHDPTTLNRQGPDVGTEYRSAVYYHNEEQRIRTEEYIDELNQSGTFANPIVTEVAPYKEFWVAEAYHQDYYAQHPENRYVQNVSRPKVEKVEKTFKNILKDEYK